MTEVDYETMMNKVIEEAQRLSRDDSLESFYEGLRAMKYLLEERISLACSDGVDFSELDDDPF